MNTSTVKNVLKCGYTLCSKELFTHPSTSRFLYNYKLERNYCTLWSMQQNRRYTCQLSPVQVTQWNLNNNNLVCFDHRVFSTTTPQNGQTALKPKTPDRSGNNKQPKDKEKSIASDTAAGQSKTDDETGKVGQQTEIDTQAEEKLSLTAKFKKMYKEYWYVLLPVHVVTSTFWFTGFYYLSTSGVDIPGLLESMHFNDAVISKLRDSSLGHAAIAYLCYKIATPIRYTVTLGGTTLSIKYLSQWGYIRPVPSKEKLKQLIDDQKAKFHHKD